MKRYTKKEIIDLILKFNQTHGRPPRDSDYKRFPNEIVSGTRIRGMFGSFNSALELAGLPTFYETKKQLRTKSCKNCNFTFISSNKASIFCSKSCAAQYNNKTKPNKVCMINCVECGVQTKPYTKASKYCSISCRNNHIFTQSHARFVSGELVSTSSIRRHLITDRGYQCECCGIATWNSTSIVLEIDHIDGNPDNNFPENLRLLCPNCHSQTPTFRRSSQQPKSDRRSRTRRKRYYNL